MAQNAAFIAPKELKRLSQLTPWRTAFAIAFDWAVIAASIAVIEWTGSWLVWLLALPVIAGRMHAFGALMHDFAHYRFIPNKKVSDWVGDIFLAWPIGATVEGYRRNHLAHHNYTNTGRDPDWVVKLGTREYTFPQEMRFAILHFLGYFIGASSWRDIQLAAGRMQAEDMTGWGYKLARGGYYLAIGVIVLWAGVWREYLLYWVVPYLTLFFLFLYVRSVAEHFGETMEPLNELQGTRTVEPHFWERWFFCPHNMNYHLDHHLYPSVPFYNLPELNAALLRESRFTDHAHLTRGYATGLFREVWLDGWRRKWRGRAVEAAE